MQNCKKLKLLRDFSVFVDKVCVLLRSLHISLRKFSLIASFFLQKELLLDSLRLGTGWIWTRGRYFVRYVVLNHCFLKVIHDTVLAQRLKVVARRY